MLLTQVVHKIKRDTSQNKQAFQEKKKQEKKVSNKIVMVVWILHLH